MEILGVINGPGKVMEKSCINLTKIHGSFVPEFYLIFLTFCQQSSISVEKLHFPTASVKCHTMVMEISLKKMLSLVKPWHQKVEG